MGQPTLVSCENSDYLKANTKKCLRELLIKKYDPANYISGFITELNQDKNNKITKENFKSFFNQFENKESFKSKAAQIFDKINKGDYPEVSTFKFNLNLTEFLQGTRGGSRRRRSTSRRRTRKTLRRRRQSRRTRKTITRRRSSRRQTRKTRRTRRTRRHRR